MTLSSYKGTNPIMRGPIMMLSNPIHLPLTLPLSSSITGLRASVGISGDTWRPLHDPFLPISSALHFLWAKLPKNQV